MPEMASTSESDGDETDSSSTIPGCTSPIHTEVFDHWNRGQRSDRHQLERALKNAFKRAYDRLLKRQTKANVNNSQIQNGGPGPSSQH
ncbi:hypothetical protein SprV_0702327700 [Sparganum proliferum]